MHPLTPERLDRLVRALMTVLDADLNIGITARATPEAIELLMQSDSPFAGYVISCLIEDDREAQAHYDDWMRRTLERRIEELGLDPLE